MSETALWKRMRAGVVEQCFVQRVENIVGSGVPDVLLHSRATGAEAWVELKFRRIRPKRVGTPIFTSDAGLRPEQKAWIYERALAGVNVWILGQCEHEVYLIHGRHARELETMDEDVLFNNCGWVTEARGTNWAKLLEVIVG